MSKIDVIVKHIGMAYRELERERNKTESAEYYDELNRIMESLTDAKSLIFSIKSVMEYFTEASK